MESGLESPSVAGGGDRHKIVLAGRLPPGGKLEGHGQEAPGKKRDDLVEKRGFAGSVECLQVERPMFVQMLDQGSATSATCRKVLCALVSKCSGNGSGTGKEASICDEPYDDDELDDEPDERAVLRDIARDRRL